MGLVRYGSGEHPDTNPEDEGLYDLSRRVTILVSYDPESDTLVLDRGRVPRVMAEGILHRIDEGEFSWADHLEEANADDD